MNHLIEESLQTFWPEAVTSIINKAPVYMAEWLLLKLLEDSLRSINTPIIKQQVETTNQHSLLH